MLAVAIAVLASRRQTPSYESACITRFSVPQTAATGTSYFDVQQTVALGELARAERGPLFTDVARFSGISATTLGAETQISPGTLDTFFVVSVTDRSGKRATTLATDLCAELATQLRLQRASEQAADAADDHDQLVALETRRAELTAGGTSTYGAAAELQSINEAITVNLDEYGTTLALPSDYVIATRAFGASRVANSTLRRDLEFAAGATPLAWFLLILISESIRRPENAPT